MLPYAELKCLQRNKSLYLLTNAANYFRLSKEVNNNTVRNSNVKDSPSYLTIYLIKYQLCNTKCSLSHNFRDIFIIYFLQL